MFRLNATPTLVPRYILLGAGQGSVRLESPKFSPRNSLLSGLGFGDSSGSLTKRPSHNQHSSSLGGGSRHGSASVGRAVWVGGEEKTGPPPAREKCPHCGAVFGDVSTLVNHVERFHPKVVRVCKRVRVRVRVLSVPTVWFKLLPMMLQAEEDSFQALTYNKTLGFWGFTGKFTFDPPTNTENAVSSIHPSVVSLPLHTCYNDETSGNKRSDA